MKSGFFKLLLSICFLTSMSCSKNSDCFDQALFDEFKDKYCTQDCPGVTGCDGKFYCNECMANSQGIRVD